MAQYRKGQELVCIKDDGWDVGFGPKKDEIVHFDGYFNPRQHSIGFDEYPITAYKAIYFVPVADITELKEILEAQPEMI